MLNSNNLCIGLSLHFPTFDSSLCPGQPGRDLVHGVALEDWQVEAEETRVGLVVHQPQLYAVLRSVQDNIILLVAGAFL